MHKSSRRSKAEAMEEMEARMLKPSISGDHLEFEGAAQRACNTSSSSSNKKLDLNAPLLSVRRLRAADAPSNARIQDAQHEQCSSSSTSGYGNWDSKATSSSLRRTAAVPFFVWEQQQKQRRRGGSGGSGACFLPVLTPPPGRLSPAHHHGCSQQGLQDEQPAAAGDGLQLGDLDARSDTVFAHTEAPSVAPTCLVSLLDGESDAEDDDCVVGQQQQQEEMVCIDAAARDFILRRFLPAAKAVANELSPAAAVYGRQAGTFVTSDVWKPLTNPSPQRLPNSRSQHEIQAQRQRFQDLLFVGDNGEDEEEEEEEEEGYESSSVVGRNICGFIPLFKLGGSNTMKIFRSRNGNQNQQQQQDQHPVMSKTWRKFEPEQRAQEHEECWSDEDGTDDPSLRREISGNYLACRYTPSRGNLGSPITIASKGFLGTPTDRVWRKTSIKRMYPIDPYENTATATATATKNSNKVNCHANLDADSDSSESLISLRLDKLSATTSRQSSVNEKIFCLDTLNQVREEAAKQRRSSSEAVGTTTYSVVDERGHPNVVVPSSDNQTLRNSADKQQQQQLGELMEQILYTSKRPSAPHLMKRAAAAAAPQEIKITEVETSSSKNSFEEDGGNYALPAEMRICWHEEEKPQAMSLPAPVGPSHSWLTSARLSSAAANSKPPLSKPYSMHSSRGEPLYAKLI